MFPGLRFLFLPEDVVLQPIHHKRRHVEVLFCSPGLYRAGVRVTVAFPSERHSTRRFLFFLILMFEVKEHQLKPLMHCATDKHAVPALNHMLQKYTVILAISQESV